MPSAGGLYPLRPVVVDLGENPPVTRACDGWAPFRGDEHESLGGAFFGESMFHRARDASKVALVHLVARLRAGGFKLLDTQFVTDHLKGFGAVEIPRRQYHKLLETALGSDGDFAALPTSRPVTGQEALAQLTASGG